MPSPSISLTKISYRTNFVNYKSKNVRETFLERTQTCPIIQPKIHIQVITNERSKYLKDKRKNLIMSTQF